MAAINKDVVLIVSLALSVVSLVLLFGVTWYFQSSLDLLQQEVEYDRELLFKLQEQINKKDNDLNKHDIVKRQSEQNCQCKDGAPGLKGPPGNKGETGVKGKQGRRGDTGPPGPRGDTGDRGPRGIIGDTGYPGPKGDSGQKGNKGDSGQRGDTGDRGPRGIIGDTGLRGSIGEPGIKGTKGDQGQKGMKGDKDKRNGGTVYVRWGHDQCPSTAQLVYSGRAGGPFYNNPGGGSNPQCLPMDPNFLPAITGSQAYRALIYGAEYQTDTDSKSHIHGRHNFEVFCAVCHVSNRTAVYMVPAKYTCPTGWTREYYGYLMSSHHGSDRHRTQYTCVDSIFKPVPGTPANLDGLLFHFVEGRCGSLPCPPYNNTTELSCAVCTK